MRCKACRARISDLDPRCPRCGYPADDSRRDVSDPFRPPSSNMVQSVLATICCVPLGLFGILFAAFSMSAAGAGDYDEAARFSALSAAVCWWALALGAALWALLLVPAMLESIL